ncbi:MAG: tRNA uridine-5-carboxymethylaminomethyl(34) synthesis GTPase MnmE [Gemmatimonadaceae bacterium]|nr:tRNA uridine-5-carboxymethylaminomethyl(34) synthesis GTPase MnmE [Gemmatimonadaceae bacterium]
MTRSAALLAGGADTIVARATADGRAALAIIRLTGAQAIFIAGALGASRLMPRVATRVTLRHPVTHARLDDALVTAFAAPSSFTGEDVVEFSTHGGRVVSTMVLAACVAAGARLALPGEFTRRAVVNGKLDVLQAEAVADLIDARTVAMQQQALAQLDGGLSRRLLALRDDVIQLEALLAYDIDFPEEDDGPIAPARIAAASTALLQALEALLATGPRATLLRDGALVVIAGPPNAGKSSLFNALLGDARALVTPIAGTTRDAIDGLLDRVPVPLRFVDTAGLRATNDTLERLGIEVSERYLASAQVVLACGASAHEIELAIEAVRPLTTVPVLPVHTKSDLTGASDDHIARHPAWHYASAETGEGLVALLERIDAAVALAAENGAADDEVVVTRERHQRGLREACEEVALFIEGWSTGALPTPIAAVHLQTARDALSALVGAIGTEDVLDRVFAEFCIGK